MICFEVSINGKKVCTAGVGDDGVLSSMLTFAKRKKDSQERHEDEGKSEGIDIRVGGIANIDPGTSEHLEWLDQYISVGDEISIRIIEAPESDPPLSRETSYLECSFCGKKQSEVLKLIAGPTTYICNECVSDCTQAIVEGEATGVITLVLGKQAEARCSFCGQKPVEVERVVGTPTAHICNECIKICSEILNENV